MAKYGPDPLPEEAKRMLVSLSISNKGHPRLSRFRSAFEAKEGRIPSKAELKALAETLSYQAIDAYCESAERDEAIII